MKTLLLLAALCLPVCAQIPSCPGNAKVNVTTGTTTVIAATALQSVHLCVVSLNFTSAVNVTINSVTSGGTSTAITGTYQGATGIHDNFTGDVKTGIGNGLSITLGSAVAGGGVITYYISRNN